MNSFVPMPNEIMRPRLILLYIDILGNRVDIQHDFCNHNLTGVIMRRYDFQYDCSLCGFKYEDIIINSGHYISSVIGLSNTILIIDKYITISRDCDSTICGTFTIDELENMTDDFLKNWFIYERNFLYKYRDFILKLTKGELK